MGMLVYWVVLILAVVVSIVIPDRYRQVPADATRQERKDYYRGKSLLSVGLAALMAVLCLMNWLVSRIDFFAEVHEMMGVFSTIFATICGVCAVLYLVVGVLCVFLLRRVNSEPDR